ncbi:hypothetical protein, partial [Pseudomonas sp. BF-R-01]|uniref:hypothetical protein n=1 Tax=Pseudomonas sp. BF-R-01 TaxID=2832365 RepID=UPI001CC13E26
MDLWVGSVRLTGEVDVGPRWGEGKLGNMSVGVMKKLGSVRGKRAGLAGVHGLCAKGERWGESAKAFAGKPRSY